MSQAHKSSGAGAAGGWRCWLAGGFVAVAAALLSTLSHAQQSITVAAFPAVDEIAKAAIPLWKKTHPNVEVKVISRSIGDHRTAMTTALSTASNLPDVMVLEYGFVGRFAESGGLENLGDAPYNLKASKAHFVPYALTQGSSKAGVMVAAPADIGPGTMLYRTDLLQKAGVSEAEMTQSWESLVASGVKIKARTGAYLVAHARNIKDIVIRSGIKPGEGVYVDSQGKVLVESPRFVLAFELTKKVREQKLDAKVNDWTNEWAEGFKRGTITLQFSGAWMAGHLNNWLAPNTRGLWHAAQLPQGSYASYGGTFYAIPKEAKNKALAWEFIQLMTQNPEVQLQAFKSKDAFPALLDVYNDAFFEQALPFLGGQQARLLWRETAKNIVPAVVHKVDPFAEEVIDTELDKVLNQGKDIRSALADAKRLIEHRVNR